MTEKLENSKASGDNGSRKSDSKQSESREKRNKKEVGKPLTKVIIRRLPPSMDEETFLKQIEPVPEHDDFYFVSGDWTLGKNSSSRAYLNFQNPDDIFLFKDKFDGYIFVDAKGVEYPAVVEYAPFQELPRNRSRKKDTKSNTIETDTHYIAFFEALKNEEENSTGKSENKLEYSYKIKSDEKVTSTPLLEFIANKRQEKREEKRRKIEDRKKQREDERQRKRNQTAKSIPEPITEENNKDDEIIVRIIPSRLDPNQRNRRNNERGGGTSEKEKSEKEKEREQNRERERNRKKERERERDREREKNRKLEKERQRKEKDRDKVKIEILKREDAPKTVPQIVEKVEAPPLKTTAAQVEKQEPALVKKEVKKYSERRKETRARAESRLAEIEKKTESETTEENVTEPSQETFKIEKSPDCEKAKDILRPDVPPFIPKEKPTIILGLKKNEETEIIPKLKELKEDEPKVEEKSVEKADEEDHAKMLRRQLSEKAEARKREIAKIRNKDRPSIQIYQPGKSRLSSTSSVKKEDGKSDDDKGKEKSDSDRSSDKSEKIHKLTKTKDKEMEKIKRKNSKEVSDDAESSSRHSSKHREKKGEIKRKISREESEIPSTPEIEGGDVEKLCHKGMEKVMKRKNSKDKEANDDAESSSRHSSKHKEKKGENKRKFSKEETEISAVAAIEVEGDGEKNCL